MCVCGGHGEDISSNLSFLFLLGIGDHPSTAKSKLMAKHFTQLRRRQRDMAYDVSHNQRIFHCHLYFAYVGCYVVQIEPSLLWLSIYVIIEFVFNPINITYFGDAACWLIFVGLSLVARSVVPCRRKRRKAQPNDSH